MNAAKPSITPNRGRRSRGERPAARLPLVLAAGSVLAGGPAAALELGAIEVRSALGQPLRASIAYALGPNEQLQSHCIFVRAGNPAAGVPAVPRTAATLANGRIELASDDVLREPMMGLEVTVDCAYTAHIRRDYLLMLDPAPAVTPVTAERESQRPARPAAATPAARDARPAPRRASQRPAAPVASGSTYRVQAGDTLSEIAARIPERNASLWEAVDALYAANPDAFIDGNRNLLKAGSLLVVPERLLRPGAPARAAAPAPQDAAAPAGAYPGAASTVPADAATTAVDDTASLAPALPEPSLLAVPDIERRPVADASVDDTADVIAEPAAEPIETIPETRIENAAEPVPVAGNQVSADNVGGSLSWLMWLGGTGIAIILGLLFFGRSVRERLGGERVVEERRRRSTDRGEPPQESSIVDDLSDTLSRAEVLTLDADLDDGTGFDSSPDIAVAQDFSFASSGDYGNDLDLTFDERSTREPDDVPTDMIAPLSHSDTHSDTVIVDEEVLPGADDENDAEDGDDEQTGYDLSMVVDATRQSFEESDASTRDLRAVEVTSLSSDEDTESTGGYTINEEAGYQLIEQDYEQELTATQALNREIEEAARELSERLDADNTSELPSGADADAVTAEMASSEDADRTQTSMAEDLEHTAEVTTEMPTEKLSANDDPDRPEVTAEMPADQDEPTVEMEPERARPRKSRAS